MHAASVSSTLSDVFPSLPMHDSIINGCVNNPLLGINGNIELSRSKYFGLSQSVQCNSNGSVPYAEDRSRTNLIINYLPQSYDQNDLQRLFERVGPIRQCKLIRDKNTGASLCYGFVDFVNPQHAAIAIQTYHGYETEQKRLRVAYASSGGRRFTPSSRLTSFSSAGLQGSHSDVTNENIIGWELCVIGVPLEWSEADLSRLFNNFGNVILVRLLAPQMSDSPPNHKARLSSPVASDLSSDSVDGNRVTTTASVIFEDKSSAELSVFRLNGYQLVDWSGPLRLRIIGPVTRETFSLFCLPARNSPAFGLSRMINGQSVADPLTESEVLSNLMNRRALGPTNCASHGSFIKSDVTGLAGIGDFNSQGQVIPPRAIIRNKISDMSNHNFNQSHSLELMELLENQINIPTSTLLNSVDRIATRDQSLSNALDTRREHEPDRVKGEHCLRTLGAGQTSPWSFGPQRSVLSSLSDTVRSPDFIGVPASTKRLSIKTPLLYSPFLTSTASHRGGQVNIWLKLENVQPTGSFKLRGMEHACKKFASSGVHHVVSASVGNAAVALAYAAHAYGLACTLVMPETEESVLRRRMLLECPNAKTIAYGSDFLDAQHRAEQLVNEISATHGEASVRLVHPYDQAELWEGYETIIDELSPEITQPDVVVVSVGGGGLLAGIIQGLWNRGWSSTHVIAVETDGADCLNRSLKAGQPVLLQRSGTSAASSLAAPIVARRTWNLAQCQSLTPVVCSDAEAADAVRSFLDDHGMLVELACGASLSVAYTGVIGRLQLDGRIPRPANVVIVVGGGRNVSLRQLSEWDSQESRFGTEPVPESFLPSITDAYLPRLSPNNMCPDAPPKSTDPYASTPSDLNETLKLATSTPNTPRPMCAIMNGVSGGSDGSDRQHNIHDRDGVSDNGQALNPHDLVNFSKLLGTSDGDGEDTGLHD